MLLWKLKAGMDPWGSGRGNIPAGCATMAIAPVGIINAGNPAQAYQDGWNIAFVDQEGHNRDGAATVAAGVAAAFSPGATVDDVLAMMRCYSSSFMQRAIELTMDLATQSDDVDAFAAQYYAHMLDWSWPTPPGSIWNKERFFSGNSVELVPITMAILHLAGADPNQAMIEAASFGRDCDTTASLVGSITGALYGASAIRDDWVATVETANRDFFAEVEGDPEANFHAMAARLVQALDAERRAAQAQADLLDVILAQTETGG
jgi:ADP-ribosylglycohydrolase